MSNEFWRLGTTGVDWIDWQNQGSGKHHESNVGGGGVKHAACTDKEPKSRGECTIPVYYLGR